MSTKLQVRSRGKQVHIAGDIHTAIKIDAAKRGMTIERLVDFLLRPHFSDLESDEKSTNENEKSKFSATAT